MVVKVETHEAYVPSRDEEDAEQPGGAGACK